MSSPQFLPSLDVALDCNEPQKPPNPLVAINHLTDDDRIMIQALLAVLNGPVTIRTNPLHQLEARTATVSSVEDLAELLRGKKQEDCTIVVNRLRDLMRT